jgi:hypothetical protein
VVSPVAADSTAEAWVDSTEVAVDFMAAAAAVASTVVEADTVAADTANLSA